MLRARKLDHHRLYKESNMTGASILSSCLSVLRLSLSLTDLSLLVTITKRCFFGFFVLGKKIWI